MGEKKIKNVIFIFMKKHIKLRCIGVRGERRKQRKNEKKYRTD